MVKFTRKNLPWIGEQQCDASVEVGGGHGGTEYVYIVYIMATKATWRTFSRDGGRVFRCAKILVLGPRWVVEIFIDPGFVVVGNEDNNSIYMLVFTRIYVRIYKF